MKDMTKLNTCLSLMDFVVVTYFPVTIRAVTLCIKIAGPLTSTSRSSLKYCKFFPGEALSNYAYA